MPCVRIGRVVALVVLDVHEYVVRGCGGEQREVVGERLHGRLGDEDVDPPLDGVQGDGVVRGVWCEDGDCVAGGEGVDGGFVREGVSGVVCRVGIEGRVETVVDLGDVFM